MSPYDYQRHKIEDSLSSLMQQQKIHDQEVATKIAEELKTGGLKWDGKLTHNYNPHASHIVPIGHWNLKELDNTKL